MKAVVFDLKGKIAHFRKPDTTATQLTYPFITPTAAKGLVGAILGIEDFVTKDKIGVQLLHSVSTIVQQMSMIKDGGSSFNRPTSIELVVKPHYRIYYVGEEHVNRLYDFLEEEHSVYPTYLGSAYALTKPALHQAYDEVRLLDQATDVIETKTIVPTRVIDQLKFEPDRYYSRAGGFMHVYKGKRTFEKSIDFIYERDGKSISFIPVKDHAFDDIDIVLLGEETVCLF
jgi:CRISPR-associated protein Cas5h